MQVSRAVWPDARIKSNFIFSNIAPKGAKADFYLKRYLFKIEQKVLNIWANFIREYVSK